jgi:hypothetical protein
MEEIIELNFRKPVRKRDSPWLDGLCDNCKDVATLWPFGNPKGQRFLCDECYEYELQREKWRKKDYDWRKDYD